MSVHRGDGTGRYVRSTFADVVFTGRRIVFAPCPNCGAIGRQTADETAYTCNQPFCGHRWGPLQFAESTS